MTDWHLKDQEKLDEGKEENKTNRQELDGWKREAGIKSLEAHPILVPPFIRGLTLNNHLSSLSLSFLICERWIIALISALLKNK